MSGHAYILLATILLFCTLLLPWLTGRIHFSFQHPWLIRKHINASQCSRNCLLVSHHIVRFAVLPHSKWFSVKCFAWAKEDQNINMLIRMEWQNTNGSKGGKEDHYVHLNKSIGCWWKNSLRATENILSCNGPSENNVIYFLSSSQHYIFFNPEVSAWRMQALHRRRWAKV